MKLIEDEPDLDKRMELIVMFLEMDVLGYGSTSIER